MGCSMIFEEESEFNTFHQGMIGFGKIIYHNLIVVCEFKAKMQHFDNYSQ
jgi:hypothetical protein